MPERENGFTWGRLVGLLFVLGGLWHAAAPWLFGYTDLTAAKVSNVVTGLILAVLGAVRVAGVRGWPLAVGAVVAVWVLIAPLALGFGRRGLAANESLWGGLMVLALAGIAALAARPGPPATRPVAGEV
jgi:hypothetical protein